MNFSLKESQTIELKQIWKDEYLKTICAFSNTDGGVLYIGIDDNGNIVGLDDTQDLLETLPSKINNRLGVLVDVVLLSHNEKEYIEIKVQKTYAPVSYHGKFYQRSGSNTIELNGGNLTNFLLKKYGKTWDDNNGATLSSEVPIEKFDKPHLSKPFNPTMAAVFYKCGFIENWGRGTNNIINQCLEYGLPEPTFEYDWEAVVTTFYRSTQDKTDGGVNGGVNELFIFIQNNPNLKTKQISESINIPLRTIERWLKQLKDEDKIEFKGSPKTGGYVVKYLEELK